MKSLKPRSSSRPSAEEALRIAAVQAPALPPTRLPTSDRPTTLNLRLRSSTVAALTEQARLDGLTQKQVVCRALAAAGIRVAPADSGGPDAAAQKLSLSMSGPPLLLHIYPSFGIGGAQVRFAAIANRFGRRWRHAIVAMDGNTDCRERLAPDLDVSFPAIGIRKGSTSGNVLRFRTALLGLRPDVLVTANFGSIEWSIANALIRPRLRQIHVEDGFGPEERSRQIPRRVLLRRLFLRRSTVVLPSRVLWRLATGPWGLDPARVRYIPNGVDLSPPAAPGELAFAGVGPVIGTVAGLRAEKNQARLLQAFRLVLDAMPARLVVVGDGPERGALETRAQALDLGGQVHFTGHVAQPQALYRGFDVFALSSDTEQMPLTVLEAMAAALPVVSTDVGDIRNMLAAESAELITALDPAALAAALLRVLAQPEQARAIGAANRKRAEQEYDQEHMLQAYAGLFDGPGER